MVKNTPANSGDIMKLRFDPWVGKSPGRRKWHPTPVFLPGKSHGQRSLAAYSPPGFKGSDMTQRLNGNSSSKLCYNVCQLMILIAKKFILYHTHIPVLYSKSVVLK